jgi:hypothetical protein
LVYKKTNFLNLVILVVYTTFVLANLEFYDQKDAVITFFNVILLLLNLVTPVISAYRFSDRKTMLQALGEPSEFETELSFKGGDMSFGQIMERADFYFACFITFTVIGSVRMIEENAFLFSKGSEELED